MPEAQTIAKSSKIRNRTKQLTKGIPYPVTRVAISESNDSAHGAVIDPPAILTYHKISLPLRERLSVHPLGTIDLLLRRDVESV